MADFDFNKLKDNVGGFVGSLKTMINPTGGTPNVDPDDALGVKIAQIGTMLKQMTDAQQEHVKNLSEVHKLLNAAFQDIDALRNSVKVQKAAEKPAEVVAAVKEEEKKSE